MHHWAKHVIHDFEHDHRVQYRFHIVAMVFWMANLVAGTVLLFLAPRLWVSIGVYYVFVLSIYANWDTDFDAVSACEAAMHAEELLDRSKEDQ